MLVTPKVLDFMGTITPTLEPKGRMDMALRKVAHLDFMVKNLPLEHRDANDSKC
jgi:hypothetical protein